MVRITDDNTIYLTRGDALYLEITMTDQDGYPYLPPEGSIVEFTVKDMVDTQKELIKKQGTEIKIDHEDTKNLEFGNYFYDVQLKLYNGDRATVIAPTNYHNHLQPNFILTKEINWE